MRRSPDSCRPSRDAAIGSSAAQQPSPDDVFAAWVKGRLALDSLDLARLPAPSRPSNARPRTALVRTRARRTGQRLLAAAEATRSALVPNYHLMRGPSRAPGGLFRSTRPSAKAGPCSGTCCRRPARREESQAAARRATALEPTTGAISIVWPRPPGARNGCAPWIAP